MRDEHSGRQGDGPDDGDGEDRADERDGEQDGGDTSGNGHRHGRDGVRWGTPGFTGPGPRPGRRRRDMHDKYDRYEHDNGDPARGNGHHDKPGGLTRRDPGSSARRRQRGTGRRPHRTHNDPPTPRPNRYDPTDDDTNPDLRPLPSHDTPEPTNEDHAGHAPSNGEHGPRDTDSSLGEPPGVDHPPARTQPEQGHASGEQPDRRWWGPGAGRQGQESERGRRVGAEPHGQSDGQHGGGGYQRDWRRVGAPSGIEGGPRPRRGRHARGRGVVTRRGSRSRGRDVRGREFGLRKGLALTAGSAVLWGLAHLVAWRGRAGLGLLALQLAVVIAAVVLVTGHRARLLTLAVQPGWLTGLAAALIAVALVWVAVIVGSWRLVRPADGGGPLVTGLVVLLCVIVVTPTLLLARLAYLSSDLVTSVFAPGAAQTPDPWKGRTRLNVLLLGADAAPNRYGVRTDSITLATISTETGRTVLFGLPRNLQHVPMPPGPARARFPWGFSGEPPHSPGLLNEVYQYAEEHPEIVPGVQNGSRGPTLLKETVSGVLGLDVDYYAMVDMRGFAQLIDAMGGVTVTIRDPIVYGRRNEGHIPAGTRRLSGEAALWFGRSRTDSSDYVRMSRQRCLLNAVAKQADPVTLLRGFDALAHAAKRAVSTDIPQYLLPELVNLSERVKEAPITSVQFVPPMIDTAAPDYRLIRNKVTQSIAASDRHRARPRATSAAGSDTVGESATSPGDPDSLDTVCR
ncbi:LCP family protein [Spongiactinospora sp. TRM90649]|uniref:LCP family protein n=1 Tax=Spongiactinospora sp. TRM90649 TaxID=3031114 RepID=UPI0023F9C389|nr:LCP family protein [Spongiactinospora sp. TRM90649]MDF5756051.1 LCP family protein [Spongiactinospora sp. TRM90649]